MINPQYKQMLQGKSVIRELSEYATARGREIGRENVFDYSLGNPSVPCAPEFTAAMLDLLKNSDPVTLHGYSPSLGIESVREAVADSLRRRFGVPYEARHIFMTTGAAGAVAHAVRCVTQPGDKVLTFAPFFPEYRPYVNGTGAELKIVPPDTDNFQIHFDAFEQMLTDDVTAVLVNTPNNPSGVVYSSGTLRRLTDIMRRKQAEFGHDIFLVSDEPYREIVFDGVEAPYVASFYDNTVTCYSFSKSLSLPGERIGYLAVNPRATDADIFAVICGQISRGLGHNCPPSLIQLAVARVIDLTSDLSVYETNMNLIYNRLLALGFTVVRPGGTFYIFPKAPEDDAKAFCRKAKAFDLILVPADDFGCPGYFRMAYCIDTEKVIRSLDRLELFMKETY